VHGKAAVMRGHTPQDIGTFRIERGSHLAQLHDKCALGESVAVHMLQRAQENLQRLPESSTTVRGQIHVSLSCGG
jgi:hypothetical protein